MSALAAIDIGSNSVRLLVMQDGQPRCREMNITRLAAGVDADGRLQPEAIERTVEVLARYGARLADYGVSRLRVAATSAARDASNREEFFDQVEGAVGARPELLSGQAEATLAFAGATCDLGGCPRPLLTLDIGGGSTELALGAERAEQSVSLKLGCVRVTERFLGSDPALPAELEAAANYTREQMREAAATVNASSAKTWVGLAGTVTSLAALDAGLSHYDPRMTHGYELKRAAVARWHERLSALPRSQRAELLIQPERAGVIVGGSVVLLETLRFFGVETLRVSEHDILDGLAASLG